ncbi:hypothetical protein NDU88_003154 [Pleurodeles waltl]|uniref:Uncharacterized protein n=1 Tax=Pleurodeles waltl TaxID=8319 RepID=A0AAV7VEZ2_PLEWA|nr:hypothetical protein NDU88_003154 [Pleurodeles waltl]
MELSGPRVAERRCREVRPAGRWHTSGRAALTTLAHKIQGGSVKYRGAALLTRTIDHGACMGAGSTA